MNNNVEAFRMKIAAGGVCFGTYVSFADPSISELACRVGYDFTWIDTEHGLLDRRDVLAHIQAHGGSNTAPFVRVPWNDPVLLKPILEMSPAGVIIPMVNTAEQAAAAVTACKYPPRGARGFGPIRGIDFGGMALSDYLASADEKTLVIVQVEHRQGVENLDSILDVDGVDSICIGPMDLSGSFGKLGQVGDPEVADAIDTICRKVKASDKLLGVATGYNPSAASGSIEAMMTKGFDWMCVNGDYGNLYQQSRGVLDDLRRWETRRP